MQEDKLAVAAPRLDRLMGLRDALVALKGPLADEPGIQENLQKRLFNEELNSLVLGKISTPSPSGGAGIPLGEAS